MRDNFRPNVRLTTNILMVFGTFLIAYKIGSINKFEKDFYSRKATCAVVLGSQNREAKLVLIEKYDINVGGNLNIDEAVMQFCGFYK